MDVMCGMPDQIAIFDISEIFDVYASVENTVAAMIVLSAVKDRDFYSKSKQVSNSPATY
ncbi:hypothetical protein Plhal304r1_c008g0031161 [Plasmopara halstedii]